MDMKSLLKKATPLVKRAWSWGVSLSKNARSLVRRAGLWIWVSLCALIGVVLFGLGLPLQNNLLQGVGGAFAGAALTLAITVITSREAVMQQNAKDANISRKNDLYFPVFTDLKSIQDRWLSAAAENDPYPRYIRGIGNEPQEMGGYPLNYPVFVSWLTFKEGPRKSDFTPKAAALLDKVQEAGANYNQTMTAAKEPARQLLDPHLKSALSDWRNEQSFQDWYAASSNGTQFAASPQRYWHEYIQRCTVPPESANHEAEMWVWAYNTLGWMVVGNIEEASTQVRYGYLNVTHMQETLDAVWFKAVLEKAWADIQALPEIHQARQRAKELSLAVDKAKEHVDHGLHTIQELYEGGEPPI
jgi:hypothetical protein